MDTYIVQVYRRGSQGELHGLVERVGGEERYPFASMEELWDVFRAKPEKTVRRLSLSSSTLDSGQAGRRWR
ncbi:MAG: hypothetical protein KIS79_10890 [Burkholderiales bacterium]|nr:hypothetical protein [Burkholderiales bacterium]